MQPLRLYGTVTSPYVRRVRIVAHLLGVPVELVDTSTDEGQAALRQVSPIWKVPAAEIDGAVVLDSHAITELLVARHGPGPLAPWDPEDVEAKNVIAVVDGALDSLIANFYLAKDGITPATSAYLDKHDARAESALRWLESRVRGDRFLGPVDAVGLPEIAVVTALGWMRFRETYPVERHPALVRLAEHHDATEAFAATRPPG